MEVKKYPYPIKNWEKLEDYSYLENEKRRMIWAWEFLRRNKEYQKEWDEVFDEYGELPNRVHSVVKSDSAEERWGLLHGFMFNPRNDVDYPMWHGVFAEIRGGKNSPIYNSDMATIPDDKVAIIIDPNYPIERQIRDGAKTLKEILIDSKRQKAKKIDPKKLITYIRILDLKALSPNRANTENNRSVIYGEGNNENTFKDALKLAQNYTNSYLEFIRNWNAK